MTESYSIPDTMKISECWDYLWENEIKGISEVWYSYFLVEKALHQSCILVKCEHAVQTTNWKFYYWLTATAVIELKLN